MPTRSCLRIVRSALDVKSWACGRPSCAAARPPSCPACGTSSREPGKPLSIVGHGLRERGIEGPGAPGAPPADTRIMCRRYVCLACGAILVVVPSGVGRAVHYSLEAIAHALALWGHAGAKAAEARAAVSTATARGPAAPERWSSLRRWVERASIVFGAAAPVIAGTIRERAARLATWLASFAPIPTTRVVVDAFFGGRFVHAR